MMSARALLSLVAISVRWTPKDQDRCLRAMKRHARRQVLIQCNVFHIPVATTDPEDALKAVVRVGPTVHRLLMDAGRGYIDIVEVEIGAGANFMSWRLRKPLAQNHPPSPPFTCRSIGTWAFRVRWREDFQRMFR
jgi:hypothetical protein